MEYISIIRVITILYPMQDSDQLFRASEPKYDNFVRNGTLGEFFSHTKNVFFGQVAIILKLIKSCIHNAHALRR